MRPRRILGVDPGLRTTGYGVVEVRAGGLRLIEGGVLQPSPTLRLEERLVQLHDAIADVVRTTHPDCMVIEELWTAYDHPQTAVLMGHARGVIALAAGAANVPVHALAHTIVKRALTGNGSARKAQVSGMVVQLLGLSAPPRPADVSDALALAIAFANVEAQRDRFAELGVVMPSGRSRPSGLKGAPRPPRLRRGAPKPWGA
jgi:crossover junction endodeoxyribonuclease RuvC